MAEGAGVSFRDKHIVRVTVPTNGNGASKRTAFIFIVPILFETRCIPCSLKV